MPLDRATSKSLPAARAKPIVLVAAVAAAAAALLRRRQAASDADLLWREATSDASR